MSPRERGEAWTGDGYGSMRCELLRHARDRIEEALEHRYHCEAIAICESVISDRLESRASFLCGKNIGFRVLGELIQRVSEKETDVAMKNILSDLDQWRRRRNQALHELVKVQQGVQNPNWFERLDQMQQAAVEGYELCKRLYWRVAELNPMHPDRVFPPPSIPSRGV